MTKDFGSILRGYRLGYRAIDGVGFVRISTNNTSLICVEIAANSKYMNDDNLDYRHWWENSEFSKRIKEILMPFSMKNEVRLHLNDAGEVVEIDYSK